jgi:hypothetical protein
LLSAPASVAQLIRGTLTTSLFSRRADGRLYYRTPSGWVPLGRI